jgi:hypothetical protein
VSLSVFEKHGGEEQAAVEHAGAALVAKHRPPPLFRVENAAAAAKVRGGGFPEEQDPLGERKNGVLRRLRPKVCRREDERKRRDEKD